MEGGPSTEDELGFIAVYPLACLTSKLLEERIYFVSSEVGRRKIKMSSAYGR